MSVTTALVDRWKTAKGVTSDRQAAKLLGITPAAVSNYRNGVSHADAGVLIRMATDLGLDPTGYVLAVQAERTTTLKTKMALQKLAARFGPFAAGLLIWISGANCAQSHNLELSSFTYSEHTIYMHH
jgi:transcriptional regulator with XRE-family HTH domain